MRKILYLAVLLLVAGCKLPESTSSTTTTGKVPSPDTPVANKSALLTWAAAPSGVVQGYKIEASGDGSNFFEIGVADSTMTSINVTGLYGGVRYYFRVRSFNQGANGPYNNIVSISL